MRVQQLLEHHGIAVNPFAEEDAQSDPVFKERCRDAAYHPVWDKVYGDPSEPATSIVFGEKGAGKTAMRMQMAGRIALHNSQSHAGRLFVIQYDDFNPFLDHFADRLSARKQREPARVLAEWKLWDHMDAILSLGVTSLVDRILAVSQPGGSTANLDQREQTQDARPPAEARPALARGLLRRLAGRECARPLDPACAASSASSPGSTAGICGSAAW